VLGEQTGSNRAGGSALRARSSSRPRSSLVRRRASTSSIRRAPGLRIFAHVSLSERRQRFCVHGRRWHSSAALARARAPGTDIEVVAPGVFGLAQRPAASSCRPSRSLRLSPAARPTLLYEPPSAIKPGSWHRWPRLRRRPRAVVAFVFSRHVWMHGIFISSDASERTAGFAKITACANDNFFAVERAAGEPCNL